MRNVLRIAVVILIAGFIVGLAPSRAAAFDGGRKGFVIGLGVGYGRTGWGVNHSGLFTSFKIGYAPTDRVMILWHSSGTFFKGVSGEWKMDGVGGLSMQVYLSSAPRAAYVIAGGGYQNVMSFSAATNEIGPGVRAGFGYEFTKHLSVEAIVQHGFHKTGLATTSNPTSFGVTLNVLGF
jgi:hypothetical protein